MRIGFVSTRFAGVDGVSLEAAKWAEVLEQEGHECYWMAGELDKNPEVSLLVPEAHFDHPAIKPLNKKCFSGLARDRQVTDELHHYRQLLKNALYEFVEKFNIEVLIPQNAITIPMNLALGAAISEFIAETNFPTIAHHHDFYWERKRFEKNRCEDFLQLAFPAAISSIRHAVINSSAQRDLSYRRGVTSRLIPNVMNFDTPLPEADEHTKNFRAAIGVDADRLLILQPTRVVPRKGIEFAIDLAAKMEHRNPVLVVTHPAGDEGFKYQKSLIKRAKELSVDLRFISDQIADERIPGDTNKFSLADAYLNADLVTFPSIYEGFGNALLEAVYFRKPVVVNRYKVFKEDIEPVGCEFVTIDQYVPNEIVTEIEKMIDDPAETKRVVDRNFQICRERFGYGMLRNELDNLLRELTWLVKNKF